MSSAVEVILRDNRAKMAAAWNSTLETIMSDRSMDALHEHVLQPVDEGRRAVFSCVCFVLFFCFFVGVARLCRWLVRDSGCDVRKIKRTDCVCKVVCYGAMFYFEAVFMSSAEGRAMFHNPENAINAEYAYLEQCKLVVIIYAMQLAYYASQMYSFVVNRHVHSRRRDHVQEQIHHAVALALIIGSQYYDLRRCGILLVSLFDPCDILLNATKLLKDAGVTWLAIPCFVAFKCVWFYCRVYYYPMWYVWVCFFEGARLRAEAGLVHSPLLHFFFSALLLALLVMQMIWSVMIVRSAVGILSKGKLSDEREPDEAPGESSVYTPISKKKE